MKDETKPPLGLVPYDIHQQQVRDSRIRDIVGAMHRYASADTAVPVYWVNELDNLLQGLLK